MTSSYVRIGNEKESYQQTIKNAIIVKENHFELDTEPQIVGVLEGIIGYIQEGTREEQSIEKGQIVFFPPGTPSTILAKEDSHLIIFHLGEQTSYLREYIKDMEEEKVNTQTPLSMKGLLYTYMEYLSACIEESFFNSRFCSIKTEELFLLLKGYYNNNELSHFFGPLPVSNTQFAHFVYMNYNKVKTVKELALKANLSLSSFDKEFRKVFNIPPYKWIKHKKTEHIYNEIYYGKKPLKIISEEYGFSSTSQMNDYCKKELGMTPGKIRSSYIKKGYKI